MSDPLLRPHFEDAVSRIAGIVGAECWRQGIQKADAEDIQQSILLQMWRSWEKIENPDAYAQRAAEYRILNLRAKSQREGDFFIHGSKEEDWIAPGNNIIRTLEIGEVLEGLSPIQRRIVQMHVEGGEPLRAIGKEVNLPKSTVNSHFRRALRLLRSTKPNPEAPSGALRPPTHQEFAQAGTPVPHQPYQFSPSTS